MTWPHVEYKYLKITVKVCTGILSSDVDYNNIFYLLKHSSKHIFSMRDEKGNSRGLAKTGAKGFKNCTTVDINMGKFKVNIKLFRNKLLISDVKDNYTAIDASYILIKQIKKTKKLLKMFLDDNNVSYNWFVERVKIYQEIENEKERVRIEIEERERLIREQEQEKIIKEKEKEKDLQILQKVRFNFPKSQESQQFQERHQINQIISQQIIQSNYQVDQFNQVLKSVRFKDEESNIKESKNEESKNEESNIKESKNEESNIKESKNEESNIKESKNEESKIKDEIEDKESKNKESNLINQINSTTLINQSPSSLSSLPIIPIIASNTFVAHMLADNKTSENYSSTDSINLSSENLTASSSSENIAVDQTDQIITTSHNVLNSSLSSTPSFFDNIPPYINKKLILWFSQLLLDYQSLEILHDIMQNLPYLKKLNNQDNICSDDLHLESIITSNVNHNFHLYTAINRAKLTAEFSKFPEYQVLYRNDIEQGVTIKIFYELTDEQNAYIKRNNDHVTFTVHSKGKVTLSGPHQLLNELCYNKFIEDFAKVASLVRVNKVITVKNNILDLEELDRIYQNVQKDPYAVEYIKQINQKLEGV